MSCRRPSDGGNGGNGGDGGYGVCFFSRKMCDQKCEVRHVPIVFQSQGIYCMHYT